MALTTINNGEDGAVARGLINTAFAAIDANTAITAGFSGFTSASFATAAQGALADSALQANSALGTPASGDLANCTGLPALGVVGTAAILGANTFTGVQIFSAAGAASTPPARLTGALFTGGTGTTTMPQLLFQPTGATAATTWSTAGSWLGINAATGFTGNFIDSYIAGSPRFSVSGGASPALTLSNGSVTGSLTRTNGGHFVVAASSAGVGLSCAGTTYALLWDTAFQLGSTVQLGWSATTAGASSNANDVRLSRNAAGILQIGTTANNALGSLLLTNLTASGTLAVTGASTLTGALTMSAVPRFNGTNTTGAGSALLGTNSPAATLTAPYTWVQITTSDGSTAYIPAWK